MTGLSGSSLVFTIPVDPGEIETDVKMSDKRLADLRSLVGSKNIPNGIEGKDLAKWGMAKVSKQILVNHINTILSDRNAPLEESERVKLVKLFNFHYADGSKMLTVDGLLLNPSDAAKLDIQHYSDLEYVKPTDEPYLIESPI